MNFIKLSLLLLTVVSTAANLKSVTKSTRWQRVKERANIDKDKAINKLSEKKLDAEEKADELKEKAVAYIDEKKQEATKWKNKTSRQARHKWDKALENAKVEE